MKRHFHEELGELKQKLVKMALLVETAIKKSVEALIDKDASKAEQVIEEEKKVNGLEIEIDEMGHGLFAMEQPVAVDLRRLTMILKINTDLERIGDHAVNIAERAIRMTKQVMPLQDIPVSEMANASLGMLKNAVDSFVNEDVKVAREVLHTDDVVDRYNNEIFLKVKGAHENQGAEFDPVINIAMVAYNLERIADLACNIAEDVIYIKQAKEVRHHIEEEQS